jgi:hypothetical protein
VIKKSATDRNHSRLVGFGAVLEKEKWLIGVSVCADVDSDGERSLLTTIWGFLLM